jgi:hypothetical protein
MAQVIFTSGDTWTPPPGVTAVTIECWGGGGAGNVASVDKGGEEVEVELMPRETIHGRPKLKSGLRSKFLLKRPKTSTEEYRLLHVLVRLNRLFLPMEDSVEKLVAEVAAVE